MIKIIIMLIITYMFAFWRGYEFYKILERLKTKKRLSELLSKTKEVKE